MGDSNNVINLNGTLSSRMDSLQHENSSTAIPELILSARRIAKRQLDASMNRMFNNADDCLFEYADKAGNNYQQNLYFDAMRELRMLKGQICKRFFLNFEAAFSSAYATPEQVASSMNINSNDTSALSLVEEDDLEESLAITQMSQRIYSECRDELSAIVIRFNEIAGYRKFTKEANPLCPDIICGSFRNATETIESSIEIKLIVFKLFDKFVVQNINSLYQEINTTLIAAGVLPTIKYAVAANDGSAHPSGVMTEPTAFVSMMDDAEAIGIADPNIPAMVSSDRRSAQATPYSYDAIHQAFQHYRSNGHQGASTAALAVNTGLPAGMQGPAHNITHQGNTPQGYSAGVASGHYVTNDIINGLSRLQTNSEYTGTHARLGTQANGQIIKTGVLSEIALLGGESSDKEMASNDADVIDIVSMMFDYILNDDRLSDRIKLAIGRLQIPIVKLAIIDKTFFAKKTHPARELLNELAFANLELADKQEDNEKILGKIDYIVECILTEFEQDSQIFEDLLIEFREFLNTEQKVDLMAKDMLLNARRTVVAALQQKIETFQGVLPQEVQLFILGPWKEVLNVIAIRDDCSGESWESATSLVEVLLWSVQTKLDAKERRLLTQNIPNILLSIHEG
ncbi:MAG: DUF1631 family protein, partial [Thiohalomonadales bacterium]